MPFRQPTTHLLCLDNIHTDTDADRFLPPSPIAQQTYADFRQEGLVPCDALEQTLRLWRELCRSARPEARASHNL